MRDSLSPVSQYNNSFNGLLKSLIGEIFVSEGEFPRYVPGRVGLMDVLVPSNPQDQELFEVVQNASPRDPRGTADINLDGVGDYERLVTSCVAWGRYSLYCVLGEMGSGKTAMLKHLEGVLSRPKSKLCDNCRVNKIKNCEPLLVRVDLNGIDGDNPVAVGNGLRRRLYNSTSTAVRSFFMHQKYGDSFLTHVRKSGAGTQYAAYDGLLRQIDDDPDWAKKTRRQRANVILSYIAAQPDVGARLEYALIALAYVVDVARRERSCAVLLIDNIDKFSADTQMALLKQTLSLQTNVKIKTLVTLRPTNFARLRSNGTMSFGVIVHSGASPLDVVRGRIEHILEHHEEERLLTQLTERVRSAVLARLRYVVGLLRQDGGNFAETLSALVGNSSRLALTVMERVLINSIIRYDETPANQGDVVRALFIGVNSEGVMTMGDPNVANLFTDGQAPRLSLLCLRILGFLYVLRNQRDARRISNIIKALTLICGRTESDVITALNYVMYWKRPLIWADSRTEFEVRPKVIRDLRISSDTLNLTVAGLTYFEKLAMSINYVQEATNSLMWSTPLVPAGSSFADINVRFRALRGSLRAVLKADKDELVRFNERGQRFDGELPAPALVSSRIVFGVGRSALRILDTERTARGVDTTIEVKEWLKLLALATYQEKELLGEPNQRIDALLATYNQQREPTQMAHDVVRQDPSDQAR